MKNFWDERFSATDYVYGRSPNEFFRSVIRPLPSGKLLLPGEGEGRNAVFAAKQGWEVTAVDQSTVGREKAMKLASENGVSIEYNISRLPGFASAVKFDMAGIIFLHFYPEERKQFHREMISVVKPGGIIVMEAFHKDQLKNRTGGPPVEEMLYSVEDLQEDFHDCELILLEHAMVNLREGTFHNGKADVVRMIARKLKNDNA